MSKFVKSSDLLKSMSEDLDSNFEKNNGVSETSATSLLEMERMEVFPVADVNLPLPSEEVNNVVIVPNSDQPEVTSMIGLPPMSTFPKEPEILSNCALNDDEDPDYNPNDGGSSDTGSSSVSGSQSSSLDEPVSTRNESGDVVAENSAEDDSQAKSSRGRKRNLTQWKRIQRKRLRNSGEAYTTSRNKKVNAKIAPIDSELCSNKCIHKCSQYVKNELRQKLFARFYAMNYGEQQAYLFGCIKPFKPLQQRKGATKHHDLSYHYKVKGMGDDGVGEDIQVCKTALLSLHSIGRKRVDLVRDQIKIGNTAPQADQRGKHANRPSKMSEDVLNKVKTFISSFPSEQSHYSRKQNPNRRYLSPELSIKCLYRSYLASNPKGSDSYVTEDAFSRIFCNEFNLGFGSPKSDTCVTCDKAKVNGEDINAEHSEDIENAKKMMEIDHDKANTEADTVLLTFDLQKTMPLPKISTSIAFYLRQLWFYNLGVHLTRRNTASRSGLESNGFMHTWVENEGGRGCQEIISCLNAFFESTGIQCKNLIVWSDSCAGQNKNFYTISFWHYLIGIKRFAQIDHKFPVVGHSYMDSDRDFGVIEKKTKGHQSVFLPDEYCTIIRDAKTKEKFQIFKMANSFYDFKDLPAQLGLTRRAKSISGEKFEISKVRWLRFEEFGFTKYRYSFSEEEVWKTVNMLISRRIPKFDLSTLRKTQSYSREINPKKLKDIETQMPYIPPIHHWFYNRLLGRSQEESDEDIEY